MLVMLGLLAGLLLVRATPDENASYYTSLLCLQYLVCAYGLRCLAGERRQIMRVCLALVLVWAGLNSLDRVLRVARHDASQHSAHNMSLYRSIEAATDFIADDWEGGAALTISYDMLPELGASVVDRALAQHRPDVWHGHGLRLFAGVATWLAQPQ